MLTLPSFPRSLVPYHGPIDRWGRVDLADAGRGAHLLLLPLDLVEKELYHTEQAEVFKAMLAHSTLSDTKVRATVHGPIDPRRGGRGRERESGMGGQAGWSAARASAWLLPFNVEGVGVQWVEHRADQP